MKTGLKILLIISGLSLTAGGLFGPIYAIFVEEIGGDLLTAGGAYAIYSISAGVVILLVSRWKLSESHPEKLITAGYALGVIGYMGYLFITNPVELFIIQMILGIAEAVTLPSYDGLFSKLIDEGRYASSWGLWEFMAYTVTAFAALIGGYLAQVMGFKFLFYVMLVLSFTGFIISLRLYSISNGFSRFVKKRKIRTLVK